MSNSYFLIAAGVDGKWGDWGAWSNCNKHTYSDNGACKSEATRRRQCNNPAPVGLGLTCYGESTTTKTCVDKPCPGKVLLKCNN